MGRATAALEQILRQIMCLLHSRAAAEHAQHVVLELHPPRKGVERFTIEAQRLQHLAARPYDFRACCIPSLTEFQASLDFGRVYLKGRPPVPASQAAPDRIRIMTWNIGRGYETQRIASTIRELCPDVACLQEVDWGNERTGGHDVLAALAEQTGMLGLFGIEFLELNSPQRAARSAGGGVTGNAVLTRFEPAATFRLPLPPCLDWEHDASNPRLPARVRSRILREPRIGQRFGLGVEIALGRRRLIACSLHLEDKFGGVSDARRNIPPRGKPLRRAATPRRSA